MSSDRRSFILNAVADALLASSGFTSIEQIVAAAHVSPQEMAQEFRGTDELLLALADMLAASTIGLLDVRDTAGSPQQKLCAFGARLKDERVASRLKALYRIALNEVTRNMGLASRLYRDGPGKVKVELARIIEDAKLAGVAVKDDSHHLAGHLMALLKARLLFAGGMGVEPSDAPPSHPADVHGIVELFCCGIRRGALDA